MITKRAGLKIFKLITKVSEMNNKIRIQEEEAKLQAKLEPILKLIDQIRLIRTNPFVELLPARELIGLISDLSLLLSKVYSEEYSESVNKTLLSIKGLEDSNDTLIDRNITFAFSRSVKDERLEEFFRNLSFRMSRLEVSSSVETEAVLDSLFNEVSYLEQRDLSTRQEILSKIGILEDKWFNDRKAISILETSLEHKHALKRSLILKNRKLSRTLNSLTHEKEVLEKAQKIARHELSKKGYKIWNKPNRVKRDKTSKKKPKKRILGPAPSWFNWKPDKP
jgi:hypothetical protein